MRRRRSSPPIMPDHGGLAPPTAVLGPTNTGKTHLAIERMLARGSGMIGLPLRLLAREVYDRIVAARGQREAALVTGEEKIIPPNPRYWICTVEAMPVDREVDFLAIDEIQLCADADRGHVFTNRLLKARGSQETMFLGSDAMRGAIQRIIPNTVFVSRPRLSKLSYAGPKKLSRLPRRSAIVAFSAEAVYGIAELVRRQRGGAAVVMGALSPRTRNAQVELYQSGEVDFLVATDAIGMGLNMDVDHVAFAGKRKFDGRRARDLSAAELAQIAGRAGRHLNDGTFGVTADCGPFDEDIIERIEDHDFEPATSLQWRNDRLDFTSLTGLIRSLEIHPDTEGMARAPRADDLWALVRLADIDDIAAMAGGGAALRRLWDVCQIPDFRKVSPEEHARLLADFYRHLMGPHGKLENSWIASHVEPLDRDDGDVDTLQQRLAQIRTWTFASHRPDWIDSVQYWQGRAREIEDKLSDALHEKLMQRFIDRRTSVLMRRLRDDQPLLAGVTSDGEVVVEGQFVGRLLGFQFIADPRAKGVHGKALRAAADKALRPELAARAAALANAEDKDFALRDGGLIWWRESAIGRLKKGPLPLRPDIALISADMLSAHMAARIIERLQSLVAARIEATISPLLSLQKAVNKVGEDTVDGLARGLGYRLVENFGVLSRRDVAGDVRALEQEHRAKLRALGVRFGEYTIFMPALLKPAPTRMLTLLWALWENRNPDEFPAPPAGRVSVPLNGDLPVGYYYAAGFRPSGARAVRVDMLERLADLIRTARADGSPKAGFETTAQMMSLIGSGGEDFESLLTSLGYRKTTVKKTKAERDAELAAREARQKAANGAKTADKAASGAEPAEKTPTKEETADASEQPTPALAATPADANPPDAAPDGPSADGPSADGAVQTPAAPAQEPAPEGGAAATASESVATDAPSDEPQAPPAAEGAPDSSQEEIVEVSYWRMPPRKPRQQKPRAAKAEGEAAKAAEPKKPSRYKPAARKPGDKPPTKQQPRRDGKRRPPQKGARRDPSPRRFTAAPPKRSSGVVDPDSPFAKLAALKGDLSAKAKTPEETS